MQIALEDGRVVEIPDEPLFSNKIMFGPTDDGNLVMSFLHDDGVTATHQSTVLIPREQVAVLAAVAVRIAEEMGIRWKAVQEGPPESGSSEVH